MAIDNTLDLSTLELREETYKINDFSREGSVVSKSAAIRYFHKLNPDIEIKQAGSFKINHQEQSVTLTVRVQPRHRPLNVSDCTAGIASPKIDQPSDLIAPLYEEIIWLKTKISDLGTKNARLTRKNYVLRETNEKLETENVDLITIKMPAVFLQIEELEMEIAGLKGQDDDGGIADSDERCPCSETQELDEEKGPENEETN